MNRMEKDSLRLSPRLHVVALPLLSCLLGAVGCNDEGGTGTETSAPDEEPLEPLACPDLTEVIAECNYKHTFEVNTSLSCPIGSNYPTDLPLVPDAFAPTQDCIDLLLELWDWEDTWFDDGETIDTKYFAKYGTHLTAQQKLDAEEARQTDFRHAVGGLHAMLFHPLLRGPDATLFVEPVKVPEDWYTNFSVGEIPVGSFVLDEHYYNAEFLQSFYQKVRHILYHDPLEYAIGFEGVSGWNMRFCLKNSPVSSSSGCDGTIPVVEVNPNFIDQPYLGDEFMHKYAVAPVFAHELGHAMGSPDHDPGPSETDPVFGDSLENYGSYAIEAMFSNAMLIGASFSRMPQKLAYLSDYFGESPVIAYRSACNEMFLRVVDLDNQYALDCTANNNTYLGALLDERDPDMDAYTEDACESDDPFACPAELDVGALVGGHIDVTVPRWVLHYATIQYDSFLVDAYAQSTTVTLPTGASVAGFSIDWIHPDSLASQFGIEVDDVVVAIGGAAASSLAAVERGIGTLTDNDELAVIVWRNNQLVTLDYAVVD